MADFDIVTVMSVLKTGMGKLPPKDQSFALSLLSQWAKKGSLSDKQVYWAGKFAGRIENGGKPVMAELAKTEVGNLDGIKALFDAAKNLKKKSLTINATKDLAITFSIATPKAMKPGTINVVDAGTGTWYGRVDGTTFEASKKTETPVWVKEFLVLLSSKPDMIASTHGKLTGSCCFCSKTLTDPQSKTVGYGPICAGHYGLPWGYAKIEEKLWGGDPVMVIDDMKMGKKIQIKELKLANALSLKEMCEGDDVFHTDIQTGVITLAADTAIMDAIEAIEHKISDVFTIPANMLVQSTANIAEDTMAATVERPRKSKFKVVG